MIGRYLVTQLPDQSRWVILDRHMWGYCTLLDDNDNLLPLQWSSRAAAEAWLRDCYRRWGNGTIPAPSDWRERPPELSPWHQR